MNIDRETFIAWMERIIERIEIADKKIERLSTQRNCLDGDELLDNQDLMFLLKVSPEPFSVIVQKDIALFKIR